MPLLNHRRNMALTDIALVSDQNDTTASPVSHAAACLCGARLPMQVRLGLKSRTRPVLDGRWACSERCLRARVFSLVRRGLPQHMQHVHRHRVPLGLLLLQAGNISREQLHHALRLAERSNDRIGEVLVRECGLSEQALAAALAQQWGCGSWDVQGVRAESAACFAPPAVLERTGMLPVRELHDGHLGIAFANSVDSQGILALQRIHQRPVDAGIAAATQFADVMARVRQVGGVLVVSAACGSHHDLVSEIVRTLQKLQPVESRWARVHNIFWMRMWLEAAALLGGVTQTEDVVDLIVHMPAGLVPEGNV